MGGIGPDHVTGHKGVTTGGEHNLDGFPVIVKVLSVTIAARGGFGCNAGEVKGDSVLVDDEGDELTSLADS